MRLAKFLAHSGVASRRAATEIVRAGRVRVDGVRELDPAREIDGERVELDGPAVTGVEARVVYALNKPAGRRLDRARHARAPNRRRAGRRPAAACTRSGVWTPTAPG